MITVASESLNVQVCLLVFKSLFSLKKSKDGQERSMISSIPSEKNSKHVQPPK